MSVFRDVLMFLDHVGIYDVVLPLLLIFSMVYAILEKTKIFGEDEINGKKYSRKNINAMIAFVAGFFVVASTQLVATIHKLVADISLIIVAFVMFMITIGVFHKEGEIELNGGWKYTFMGIAAFALVLIFFNALGWLMPAWYYVTNNWNSTFVSTILLLGGIGIFMWKITDTSEKKGNND